MNGQNKKGMSVFTLIPVKQPSQIEKVAELADRIWREYYSPIIGEEQVAYMLANLQSAARMQEDISSGKIDYFLIEIDSKAAGYAGLEWRENSLFLSKLYLLPEARGKGYASSLLRQLAVWVKAEGKAAIELTVNKNNLPAIHFYEAFGFEKTGAAVFPIGGGFVMDDYLYEYRV